MEAALLVYYKALLQLVVWSGIKKSESMVRGHWTVEQGRTGHGGSGGSSKVSLEPALPYYSTPCSQLTLGRPNGCPGLGYL
jgi:hypothetical protein